MFKRIIMYLLAIFTISIIINQTILSTDEKPEVSFKLADKTIPYKIANYSWGSGLDKDHNKITNVTYKAAKNDVATPAFKGEQVKIHFSKQPDNVEILEHTATKKSYIYDQILDNYGCYSFEIGTKKGERIYEVKGIWKGNNYFTYLLKVKIV